MKKLGQYAYNLALGLDQLANVVLLGDPDESISGRTGRAMNTGCPKFWVPFLRKVLDAIFEVLFDEKEHCKNAVEHEECPAEKELWAWHLAKGAACDIPQN